MSLVSFVKTERSNIKRGIEDSLRLINYKFPNNIKSIAIKPNMCYYWDYSTGQTTDPRFVAAVIEILREKISPDVDISIVESDASAMKCKYAFKILGYEKIAQEYGVNLINLSEDKTDIIEVTAGGQTFHLKLPHTIQNADLKINIAKIKYTIDKIKITCALKNIFGCNPYPKKFRYHPKLEEAIVAINKAMKFNLCLIDDVTVSGTQPCRLGLVMASQDLVAIDVAAAKIAGINPKTIKYIQLAHKEGLGNTTFIQKGAPLDYFKKRYPKKNPKSKLLSKAYAIVIRMGLGKRLGSE